MAIKNKNKIIQTPNELKIIIINKENKNKTQYNTFINWLSKWNILFFDTKEYEWLIKYSNGNGNGNGNGVYYTSHGLGPLFFSIFRKKQRDIKSLVYETRLFVLNKKGSRF